MKNFLVFSLFSVFILASCSTSKSDIKNPPTKNTYIKFTLSNLTDASIPLIIPTVMNPNLSPNSDSGVTLKIGQKIYFKNGWKKYLLLEVDESIKSGSKLDVAQLLNERKMELGLI